MKKTELSSNQLRRLEGGMADPIDSGQDAMTIRKDHVVELVAMIKRRDVALIDFVSEIEALLEDGKPDRALDRCKKHWHILGNG